MDTDAVLAVADPVVAAVAAAVGGDLEETRDEPVGARSNPLARSRGDLRDGDVARGGS